MRRREKFIICAILLSLGLLGVQYVSLQFRFLAVFIFFALSYIVSAWALYDDLHGIEWLTIIPFPATYALSVSLFYFLLPSSLLSRIFILGLFGVGMYALYLTSNIYSVAKARTIQLLRAAHTIGFLFTLLTSVLLANTIFSFHFHFWINGALLFLAHLPLFFMTLWSVELETVISKKLLHLTVVYSLLVGQLGMIVSFFPIGIWTASLIATSLVYVLIGLSHSHLQGKLFHNTIREYIIFTGFIFLAFIMLIEWK